MCNKCGSYVHMGKQLKKSMGKGKGGTNTGVQPTDKRGFVTTTQTNTSSKYGKTK